MDVSKLETPFENSLYELSDEEYNGLEEDIKARGCLDPILVWNNKIIDGHNRFRICTKNNIDFEVVELFFENDKEAEEWIYSHQAHRRNWGSTKESLKNRNKKIYQTFKKQIKFGKCKRLVAYFNTAKIFGLSIDQVRRIVKTEKQKINKQKANLKNVHMPTKNGKSDASIPVQEDKKTGHNGLEDTNLTHSDLENVIIPSEEIEVKNIKVEDNEVRADLVFSDKGINKLKDTGFISGKESRDETKQIDLAVNFLEERKFKKS